MGVEITSIRAGSARAPVGIWSDTLMKVKRWQLAVISIGLLMGVGLTAFTLFSGNEVKLAHRYYLIDVESGQIYAVDTTRYTPVIPAIKPGTDRRTLLPVEESKGEWRVPTRWLSDRSDMPEDVKFESVDDRSGAVAGPARKPVAYTPPKWD